MNEHPDTAIKVVDEADTDMTAIPVKMSDDSKALVEAINRALQELKADGSLGRLSEQFFGLDLTKPSN